MSEAVSVGKKLRITGLLTVVIGLIIGVPLVVTIGSSCGFLGGLVIVFCFLASIIGGIIFVSGLIIDKRSQKRNPSN